MSYGYPEPEGKWDNVIMAVAIGAWVSFAIVLPVLRYLEII